MTCPPNRRGAMRRAALVIAGFALELTGIALFLSIGAVAPGSWAAAGLLVGVVLGGLGLRLIYLAGPCDRVRGGPSPCSGRPGPGLTSG
jgi:hypothetical protein